MINEYCAKKYCSEPLEKIENYSEAVADKSQVWHCHHRLEVNNFNSSRNDGGIVSKQQLIEDGMYFNRPACELIFVTSSQHKKIHKELCSKGGKISGKITGPKNVKIMNAKMTFEQRSKAGKIGGKLGGKNQPREAKARGGKIGGKIAGKMMKGKHWWNNGSIETEAFDCPGPRFVRGRLKKGN